MIELIRITEVPTFSLLVDKEQEQARKTESSKNLDDSA